MITRIWISGTHTLLFTAYGTSLGLVGAGKSSESADEFRDAVAVAGLSIAAAMLLALSTVMLSKGVSWWRYKRMYECQRRNPGLPAPVDRNPFRWGAFTLNTVVSLAADLAVPIVFVVTWSLLV